jgi:signal transduction histidine kinase
LVHAIEGLVTDFIDRTDVPVAVDVQGSPRRLETKRELILYRIAQEALRNVEKHSGAEHVSVSLSFSSDGANLRVGDDGCGFEPREVFTHLDHSGLGLRGMQERTKLVGGALTIESHPGHGTCIEVQAPNHQE